MPRRAVGVTLPGMRSSLPKLLAATVAACALLPAAANAATISLEGGTYVYRPDAGENVSLLVSGGTVDGAPWTSFSDGGASVYNVGGTSCKKIDYDDRMYCPRGPLRIEGSEGNDSISLFSASEVPDSLAVTIDGKGGDDELKDTYDGRAGRTIIGGAGNDKIQGYAGNDTIDGGEGNDTVDGGVGADTVLGGAGDDVMWGDHYGDPAADVLDGGPGYDQIDEWTTPGGDYHPMPTVSLDGVANDGRPGENDNVTNIEKFQFHVSASFTGSDVAETVEVTNAIEGPATLAGNGGNDVLKAWDTDDTVDGGTGDDQLEGGLGNDVITGGPGKDTIMGESRSSYCTFLGSCKVPFGSDTIHAQDGEADTIDCGVGEDTAYVDPQDTVSNCETVIKGAAAGPGGPADTPKDGGGGPAAKLAFVGKGKVSLLRAGRLSVKVPCASACRISVTAKIGKRTVATGRTTLLKAGTAKIKLKPAGKQKGYLRKLRTGTLKVTATIKPAEGKTQKLSRSLKLKK